MGYRKRMIWLPVLLMLLLCVMPAAQAAAEEAEVAWLRTEVAENNVIVNLCVNTTVADGMIELRYDSAVLTFTEVVVDSQYVAARAVNAKEEGLVKIAWVAPGDYNQDDTVHVLMQVKFTGTSADSLTLTGALHTPEAQDVAFTTLDFTQLDAAIANAKTYGSQDYTAESFAALTAALNDAQAVRADVLSGPAQIQVAVEKLNHAVDALVEYVVPPTQPTEPTQPVEPTQPADPTEPKDPTTTEPIVPEPAPGPQNGSGLWIVIVAALAAAAAAVVVILKKKEVHK